MYKLLSLAVLFTSCAGARVTTFVPLEPLQECSPTIKANREAALAEGPIEEVCRIDALACGSGYRAGSAIECASKEVCGCGVTHAYIQSTQDMSFFENASAVLVGYRYKKKP